jgi:CcmD family protein
MDNISFLFWAYAILWIALFVYVYRLFMKSKELRGEIEMLKDSLLTMKNSPGKSYGAKE